MTIAVVVIEVVIIVNNIRGSFRNIFWVKMFVRFEGNFMIIFVNF